MGELTSEGLARYCSGYKGQEHQQPKKKKEYPCGACNEMIDKLVYREDADLFVCPSCNNIKGLLGLLVSSWMERYRMSGRGG